MRSIAIFLFDNFAALDVAGPYEVLSKLPDAQIFVLAQEKRLYANEKGLKIYADYTLDELPYPDIIVIPGGFGIDAQLSNQSVLHWLNEAHKKSVWTISICSGALLLAAAGILKGRKATTHWNRKKQLLAYDVLVEDQRYVHEGKIITSAGVSAGIDMSLYLIGLIAGEPFAKAIQLGIEYDPKPPFDYSTISRK